MSKRRTYVLGGAQTDFSINWHRDGKEISDVLKGSFDKALDDCSIDPGDIESVHIGNFVGELFCGQGLLGGVLVNAYPKLSGIPTMRHEAACASGSMAILSAMREIEAGHYDLIAVSGVEMMRNVDGKTASEYLGAATWVGHEATNAIYPWVNLFSKIKGYYQDRYGIKDEHLAAIAKTNYSNAKCNGNAHTRAWNMPDDCFSNDDQLNPIIEGKLRKSDCGRISDGSATVFLASEKYTQAYIQNCGLSLSDIPYIKGWGHRTAPITLSQKLKDHNDDGLPFTHLQGAINDALTRADITDPYQLDAIETHDCFTISEYIAIEHFGLTAPGEAWKIIENDTITLSGDLPINPSGGLIGSGHPVGATGVRMLLDAYKQVANKAKDYQVDGAKNIGVLNIGGSFTAVASFVIGR